jgi:hypothetical protein
MKTDMLPCTPASCTMCWHVACLAANITRTNAAEPASLAWHLAVLLVGFGSTTSRTLPPSLPPFTQMPSHQHSPLIKWRLCLQQKPVRWHCCVQSVQRRIGCLQTQHNKACCSSRRGCMGSTPMRLWSWHWTPPGVRVLRIAHWYEALLRAPGNLGCCGWTAGGVLPPLITTKTHTA